MHWFYDRFFDGAYDSHASDTGKPGTKPDCPLRAIKNLQLGFVDTAVDI
ncbi:hypothetical protein AB7M29_002352 [Pseudomonas sp. F-14 TE3623]